MNDSTDFFVHFGVLDDPRVDRSKTHLLPEILFIAICTIASGGDGFTDMEMFGRAKKDWLRKYLKLPGGIPSHDTFGRVLSAIDPKAFAECFVNWTSALHSATKGEVIALDGKTIRHSFDVAPGKKALHLVSAWASENGLSLGHVKVDSKSNEIKAIPKLLDMIDISGHIVTTDAMGCQKEIAEKIVEKKGDYVFCLKGNHGSLHEEVKYFFDEANAADFEDVEHSYFESVEKDHGRIEIRRAWVVEDDAIRWLEKEDQWPGLRSIAAIESQRKTGGKTTVETRYFISSLADGAAKLVNAARKHWGIENSLHYVLDVTFNEDTSRIRKDNAPENLATLRKIVINLIKRQKNSKASIRSRLKKAAWDNSYLETLLVS